jgi:hypothetical protein
MSSDLAGVVKQIETIAVDAERVFGSLSPSQLNWKPGAERWSVGQCFDHLITTNQSYFPAFDSVIAGQKKSSVWQKLPLLPGVWGKLLIKYLDPASTRKIKAPKKFEPAQSDVKGSIIHDFVAQQATIAEKMRSTANLDPERIVITSPAAAVVTYSLMDAYRIIAVHERRHFQQAQRVTEESGFPA